MRMMLAFFALATPVVAQDGPATFNLPAGCEAYVTIQYEMCTVDHQFTCSFDPEGHQRRASLDEQGMIYAGMIDAETQWIDSFHALNGHREQLEADPVEPA
jgi:hypothetical protein